MSALAEHPCGVGHDLGSMHVLVLLCMCVVCLLSYWVRLYLMVHWGMWYWKGCFDAVSGLHIVLQSHLNDH